MDYKDLRELMVRTQLIPRGIRDKRVLDAMERIPRHLFVDRTTIADAYSDMALPIGEGQTISQPYMVAVMTELLELRGSEKVLEVGTGSGYQSAVLAELARDVYTIERFASLGELAKIRFQDLSFTNIHSRIGDGTLGWLEEAPFDRIIITAGAPEIPEPLIAQLADGGIIVIPVGGLYSQQLLKTRKKGDNLIKEYHTLCVFVPLIGRYGWKRE
ncbi:MAG: protein-L-isoaspartate(D-aspartate) O-methyltransferase [Nitrospirota bacterium]|nr:protein-L-isoaspartate(D-aspartate) O-methyltransferase [Nitrospirota bacterium]